MLRQKKILLVHGMLMHRVVMCYLYVMLWMAGYDVVAVSYKFKPTEEELRDLLIRTVKREKPYGIIGHSLGGKVVVKYLHELIGVRVVVCLGSPLKGSMVAQEASRSWVRSFMSDGVRDLLLEQVRVPKGCYVGMIAGRTHEIGTRNLLDKKVFGDDTAHDGTVAVKETVVDGLSGITIVDSGHSGILFSRKVVRMIDVFLRTGHFKEGLD